MSSSGEDIHGNMKACNQDNYEAHKNIFSIFWENIFNIKDIGVFI